MGVVVEADAAAGQYRGQRRLPALPGRLGRCAGGVGGLGGHRGPGTGDHSSRDGHDCCCSIDLHVCSCAREASRVLDLTGIVTGLSNVCQVLADALYSVRMDHYAPTVRIGELSRRVGLSVHVLRAWESRYGLITPVRTDSGYRLYSAADERRVRRMRAYLADGLSPAQAARAVLADDRDDPGPAPGPTTAGAAIIRRAMDDLDEMSAQAALDRLFAEYTVETVIDDVLMPYLHELGERWVEGSVSVAQEHFASNVIRGAAGGVWPAGGVRAAGRSRCWHARRVSGTSSHCWRSVSPFIASAGASTTWNRGHPGRRGHKAVGAAAGPSRRDGGDQPGASASRSARAARARRDRGPRGARGCGRNKRDRCRDGCDRVVTEPGGGRRRVCRAPRSQGRPSRDADQSGTAKEVEDEQHPQGDRGAGDPAR